jgi:hypothetical protein
LRPLHASTDTRKSTAEEWRGVTTHHATSTKMAQVRLTPSSNGEASPRVAIHGAEQGARASKMRHKQRCREAVTNDDGGINERAGGSGAERASEATGSSKRQARSPKDHFEKLLKETCLNHAYPIKHKLRDCGLMKSFMTTGSLS